MGIRSSSAPFDEYGFELVKKDLERLSLKQYQIIYQPQAIPADNLVPSDFTRQTLTVCVDGVEYNQDFLAGPLVPIV